jgi:hypothetical protein
METTELEKLPLDGSTNQLLLSVEYCGNFVSSTDATPSVYEIHYYVLENLK